MIQDLHIPYYLHLLLLLEQRLCLFAVLSNIPSPLFYYKIIVNSTSRLSLHSECYIIYFLKRSYDCVLLKYSNALSDK